MDQDTAAVLTYWQRHRRRQLRKRKKQPGQLMDRQQRVKKRYQWKVLCSQ